MHFVILMFSNHVEVLHSVTPIDLLAQSAVLSDGVVVAVLHKSIPLHKRGIIIPTVQYFICATDGFKV